MAGSWSLCPFWKFVKSSGALAAPVVADIFVCPSCSPSGWGLLPKPTLLLLFNSSLKWVNKIEWWESYLKNCRPLKCSPIWAEFDKTITLLLTAKNGCLEDTTKSSVIFDLPIWGSFCLVFVKVENILKGCLYSSRRLLDSIQSHSPSVKIQIMGIGHGVVDFWLETTKIIKIESHSFYLKNFD